MAGGRGVRISGCSYVPVSMSCSSEHVVGVLLMRVRPAGCDIGRWMLDSQFPTCRLRGNAAAEWRGWGGRCLTQHWHGQEIITTATRKALCNNTRPSAQHCYKPMFIIIPEVKLEKRTVVSTCRHASAVHLITLWPWPWPLTFRSQGQRLPRARNGLYVYRLWCWYPELFSFLEHGQSRVTE